MKNKKIYVVCLISSLILSIVACNETKKKAPDEQNTTVVCSEIKNEADCNSKNCLWNEDSNICQDKVVETNEDDNNDNGNENLEELETSDNDSEIVNNPADNNDSETSKEEEKSEEEENNPASNNDSETNKEEEKPVVKPEEVVEFKPTECSDFTGDNLEKCGMINLTTKSNRIICNIVNNIDKKTKKVVSSACKQVTECEDIKVPAKSTKDKTPNPESLEGKRCAAQGCFVRKGFFGNTCHTNKE